MQNDISEYNKAIIRTDSRTKFDPDLRASRKLGKGSKKTSRKPSGKALIQALSKRFEKYGSINNLAQAQAGIIFGQIGRDYNNFAEGDLQKILTGRLNRATVTFADKDKVHGLSIFWSECGCIQSRRWHYFIPELSLLIEIHK